MRFFGFSIGGNNTSSNQFIQTNDAPSNKGVRQEFGTPLGPVLKGDITKPYVDSTYVSESTFVPFSVSQHGYDNTYPQLIDRMYYQSPLHSSIVEFKVNAAIGGGFKIVGGATDGIELVNQYKFIKKAEEIMWSVGLDMVMHYRSHIKITKDAKGVPVAFESTMPSEVRLNKSRSLIFVSEDWERTSYYDFYKEFSLSDKSSGCTYLNHQRLTRSPGQKTYAIPKEVSAYNFISMDGQTGALYKKALEKTIYGSLVIRRPKEFADQEEFEMFKKGIQNKEGEIVPVLVLAGNDFSNVPEVTAFPTTANDKLFENADQRIDVKICQAHNINPLIMGISTKANSLSNGTEAVEAYLVFEKQVVMPLRKEIESIMNDLMLIFGIKGTLIFNNFQIIDGEIVNKTNVEQKKQNK